MKRTFNLLVLVTLLALTFSAWVTPAHAVLGAWSSAASMAAARLNGKSVTLPDGRVFVAGGQNASYITLNSAELYDPGTNTWSAAASMSNARYFHTLTLLANGKVLVTGGHTGSAVLNSAELYDPATNSWSSAGTMAATRMGHTATLLPNGKVLVACGGSSAELYDPATNSWSAAASMSIARYSDAAVLLQNGKVLVVGGHTGASFVSTADLYDPATDSWSSAGSMTVVHWNTHTATLLQNGKVLVVGGHPSGDDQNGIANADLYDPATNTWSAAASMGTARTRHTATLLADGKVLVAGGGPNNGSMTNSTELYDPATNTWTASGSLATARNQHTSALLQNGDVLAIGGYNGSGLASAELYDGPAAGPLSYTVTYALGGGSGSVPTDANNYLAGDTVNVLFSPLPTRLGYTFAGWSDGVTTYTSGGTTSFTIGAANVTLTAIWAADLHTVTYALGGGSGTLPTQADVATDGAFTVASGAGLTRVGYTFAGWNDGTNTYAAGATYTMGASNVTLTAVWAADLHTVTYALGGGSGTLPTQADVATDGAFTVASGASLTRAGYTFAGWNDGTNTYAAGATYTMGVSNVTLTAVWTADLHTVTYALGGGSGTLPTQADVATDGAFTVASGASLTRAGYTFAGWNDGTNTYAAGATYTMGVSNVTLTAVWTADLHTVTYALGGGSGTLPTQANVATDGAFTVASGASLTRVGYTFAGWNDGTNTFAAGATYTMGASNVTLTAQWTALPTYTVTYALGGGGGSVPSDANNYLTGATVNVLFSPLPTRANYAFAGWSNGVTTYTSSGTTSFTMGSANVTLTAQWTPLYTVTYNGNGNTGGSVPAGGIYLSGATVFVQSKGTLTKTNYTFEGWNTKANGAGTDYAAGASFTISSNVTLYAIWSANTYTVTYNGNGNTSGSVPADGNKYTTGATVVARNKSTLARTNYTFAGWNTKANGSGTDYAAGASFAMGTANVTLFAKWEPVIYSKAIPSTAMQDSWILETSQAGNAGGVIGDVYSSTLRLGDSNFRSEYRSILSFATYANLPPTAVITKVTLKVRKESTTGNADPVAAFQGFMADIIKGVFGTAAVQQTDWQTTADKTVGPFTSPSVSGWYSLDLTAAKTFINTRANSGGLTQIRLRFKQPNDTNNNFDYLSIFSGNAVAASQPQLIIEYTLP